MRKGIAISLDNEIIEKINGSKGKNEPRSRFIEDIISEFLAKKENPAPDGRKTKETRPQEKVGSH